jgi:hypothetical protein
MIGAGFSNNIIGFYISARCTARYLVGQSSSPASVKIK